MATSFLDKALGAVRGVFSGTASPQNTAAAPTLPGGPTGVERYLQNLASQQQPKAAGMTGVEKYLAQLNLAEAAQAADAKTGVEKYLDQQAEEPAVAAEDAPTAAPAEEPEAASAPEADATVPECESAPESEAAPVEEPAPAPVEESAAAPVEEPAGASEEPVASEAPEAQEPAQPAGVIDLAAQAKQCQGSTLKGTQCRHTNGLERIKRTINGQEYQFAVCSHHNTAAFKPYPGLLQN
jgi:hypothetical protein